MEMFNLESTGSTYKLFMGDNVRCVCGGWGLTKTWVIQSTGTVILCTKNKFHKMYDVH